MAYTEFYCDATNGANINAGDNTANGVVTSTNGGWSTVTNIFTAAAGTPFSGVSVGDFASVYIDGATVAVYIGRVTNVGGGGATLTISSTAKMGTAPTTSGTARSCTTGGAWKGPNAASSFPFNLLANTLTNAAANPYRVNLKNNATYPVTSGITWSNVGPGVMEGYTSSAGDGGRAIIDGGTTGASYNLFTMGSTDQICRNMIFQNNGATGTADGVIGNGGRSEFFNCTFNNTRGSGLVLQAASIAIQCEAYACNQSNFGGAAGGGGYRIVDGVCVRCTAHHNTGTFNSGFTLPGGGGRFVDCIADSNGQHGFTCPAVSATVGFYLFGCVARNNGVGNSGRGVDVACTNGTAYVENCTLEGNGAYGISYTATTSFLSVADCAYYNNATAMTNGVQDEVGAITLTASPFSDAANGDFSLNSSIGAGASCRNKGLGTFFQNGTRQGLVSAATNANPIAVTTGQPHGLTTGATVTISGGTGNTNVNGTFAVTVTSTTAFTIPVAGNGAYNANSATWTATQYTKTTTSYPDVGAAQHQDSGAVIIW